MLYIVYIVVFIFVPTTKRVSKVALLRRIETRFRKHRKRARIIASWTKRQHRIKVRRRPLDRHHRHLAQLAPLTLGFAATGRRALAVGVAVQEDGGRNPR